MSCWVITVGLFIDFSGGLVHENAPSPEFFGTKQLSTGFASHCGNLQWKFAGLIHHSHARSLEGVLGLSMLRIVAVFEGSGETSCLLTTWTRNDSFFLLSLHISLLTVAPADWSLCNILCSLTSWLPKIKTSLMWQSTPGRHNKMLLIFLIITFKKHTTYN